MRYESEKPTQNCTVETARQFSAIKESINKFVAKENHYPLPANPTLQADDTKNGESVDVLDAASELTGATAPSGGKIYIGALPFQSLGLSKDFAADCYGNKLTYAVAELLTNPSDIGGYSDFSVFGNLAIERPVGVGLARETQLADAAYVVLSHGIDGVGATKANGALIANPCTATNPPTNLQQLNCDQNTAFVDASYNAGVDAGVAYFDDAVLYERKRPPTVAAGAGGFTGRCPLPWDATQYASNGAVFEAYSTANDANCTGQKATFTCKDGVLTGGNPAIHKHRFCAPLSQCMDYCGELRTNGEQWVANWQLPNMLQQCNNGAIVDLYGVPGVSIVHCN